MAEWQIIDHTKLSAGYLTLEFEGRRVCDFFPFAKGVEESLIRQQADLIAATMNEAEELRRLSADSRISSELIGSRIRNTYAASPGSL